MGPKNRPSWCTVTSAAVLKGMADEGRTVYWAEDGAVQPVVPEGTTPTRVGSARVRYATADNGPVPPPLRLREVDHAITWSPLKSARSSRRKYDR